MCTLIVGRDIPAEGTVLIAANRDEDSSRPSDPPRVLLETPRVVGGRDRAASGTWLAIRERRAVVAMLNRRPPRPDLSGPTRSRGLLALDVASVTSRDASTSLAEAARAEAQRQLERETFAPFSLAFLSPERCWLLTHDGEETAAMTEIGSGWHVLTHSDLDDTSEPRTARLVRMLADFRPRTVDEGVARLAELLATHEGASPNEPAVCIHSGRMVTVSSSIVTLARDEVRYLHAEGRPCEQPMRSSSTLLEGERREVGLG